jgi:hypothetical protein
MACSAAPLGGAVIPTIGPLTPEQRRQVDTANAVTPTPDQWTAVRSAAARESAEASKGASGRPRVARCPCGKYSLARAAYRGHKCA